MLSAKIIEIGSSF